MHIYERKTSIIALPNVFLEGDFLAKAYVKSYFKSEMPNQQIQNYMHIYKDQVLIRPDLQREAGYGYYVQLNVLCTSNNKSNLEVIEEICRHKNKKTSILIVPR